MAEQRNFFAAIKHLSRAQRSLELAMQRDSDLGREPKVMRAARDLTTAANELLDVAEARTEEEK